MIFLNKENAFIGAEVKHKNGIYYVVKVNEKSVYLSQYKNFLDLWDNRPKGITWKKFCGGNDTFMTKYESIEISETEISRGNNFIVSRKKKEKRYLKPEMEKVVHQLYKRFLNGKGSWKHITETTRNKQMIILEFRNNGQALIRFENDFFFYDLETNKYTFYKKLNEQRKTKKLVWPRESKIESKIITKVS